jgi:hypothetical protein
VNCGAIPLLVVAAHRDIGSLSDPTLQQLASLPEAAQHASEIVPQALSVKAVARWLATVFRTQRGDDRPRHADPREDGRQPALCMSFSAASSMTGWWCITNIRTSGITICRRSAPGITPKTVTLVLEQLEELPDETRRLLGSAPVSAARARWR